MPSSPVASLMSPLSTNYANSPLEFHRQSIFFLFHAFFGSSKILILRQLDTCNWLAWISMCSFWRQVKFGFDKYCFSAKWESCLSQLIMHAKPKAATLFEHLGQWWSKRWHVQDFTIETYNNTQGPLWAQIIKFL